MRSCCRHCAISPLEDFFFYGFFSHAAHGDTITQQPYIPAWTLWQRSSLSVPLPPVHHRDHWTAASRSPVVVTSRSVPPPLFNFSVAFLCVRAHSLTVAVASACVSEDRILWATARTRTTRHDDPHRLLLLSYFIGSFSRYIFVNRLS